MSHDAFEVTTLDRGSGNTLSRIEQPLDANQHHAYTSHGFLQGANSTDSIDVDRYSPSHPFPAAPLSEVRSTTHLTQQEYKGTDSLADVLALAVTQDGLSTEQPQPDFSPLSLQDSQTEQEVVHTFYDHDEDYQVEGLADFNHHDFGEICNDATCDPSTAVHCTKPIECEKADCDEPGLCTVIDYSTPLHHDPRPMPMHNEQSNLWDCHRDTQHARLYCSLQQLEQHPSFEFGRLVNSIEGNGETTYQQINTDWSHDGSLYRASHQTQFQNRQPVYASLHRSRIPQGHCNQAANPVNQRVAEHGVHHEFTVQSSIPVELQQAKFRPQVLNTITPKSLTPPVLAEPLLQTQQALSPTHQLSLSPPLSPAPKISQKSLDGTLDADSTSRTRKASSDPEQESDSETSGFPILCRWCEDGDDRECGFLFHNKKEGMAHMVKAHARQGIRGTLSRQDRYPCRWAGCQRFAINHNFKTCQHRKGHMEIHCRGYVLLYCSYPLSSFLFQKLIDSLSHRPNAPTKRRKLNNKPEPCEVQPATAQTKPKPGVNIIKPKKAPAVPKPVLTPPGVPLPMQDFNANSTICGGPDYATGKRALRASPRKMGASQDLTDSNQENKKDNPCPSFEVPTSFNCDTAVLEQEVLAHPLFPSMIDQIFNNSEVNGEIFGDAFPKLGIDETGMNNATAKAPIDPMAASMEHAQNIYASHISADPQNHAAYWPSTAPPEMSMYRFNAGPLDFIPPQAQQYVQPQMHQQFHQQIYDAQPLSYDQFGQQIFAHHDPYAQVPPLPYAQGMPTALRAPNYGSPMATHWPAKRSVSVDTRGYAQGCASNSVTNSTDSSPFHRKSPQDFGYGDLIDPGFWDQSHEPVQNQ
jgi:hypothetical protein